MTEQELQQERRFKWHVDSPARAVRTIEAAAEFMDSAGFCLTYPVRPPLVAPTFIGAFVGSEENLPSEQLAFRDPRASEAKDLMVRLLRRRKAYEAALAGEGTLLLSEQVFSFFYALVGDRNPTKELKRTGPAGKVSQLTEDAFGLLQREGPISKRHLLERLGGALSEAGLDRVLHELWSSLRITRVDYDPKEGVVWDVLYRWSPEAVKRGTQLSMAEAVSAMVSKYLDCVIAAEQSEIESFFAGMASRSKIREAVNALLAARELSFLRSGKRTLIQIAPAPEPHTRGLKRRLPVKSSLAKLS